MELQASEQIVHHVIYTIHRLAVDQEYEILPSVILLIHENAWLCRIVTYEHYQQVRDSAHTEIIINDEIITDFLVLVVWPHDELS